MTEQQQLEVDNSLLEIERGETIDYELAMKKHRTKKALFKKIPTTKSYNKKKYIE